MAALARTKQKLAEKLNRASGSKYTAEFEASCVLMEGMGAGTEELVERLKKHLETLGSLGGLLVVEQLGEAASRLGAGLPSSSPYGQSLLALGRTQKDIGVVERTYVRNVQETVLPVFQDWIKNKFKNWKKEREKLEKMRLDMDRAAGKAREKPEAAELKVQEETFTTEHSNQMALVQRLLEQVPADLDLHKAAVSKLLVLQHTLHSSALTHIDAFLRDIAPRL